MSNPRPDPDRFDGFPDQDHGDDHDQELQELLEDLATAEKVLEEYEATGIEGTISYREYRAKRLGRNPE